VEYRPKSWGYQLQDADPRKIAKSKYGLVVIDYEQDGPRSFTSAEIKLMKAKGATKLVSYVSIGEAEDYRDYWKKGWSSKPPAWLERENPDWEGNYKVRYWQKDWQKLTIDRIKEVARAGYDGAYLDIIDAYEYFASMRASAAKDMVNFVAKIAAAARKINPEFLIIPQNGEGLLKYGKYLSMIDGIGKEDLFYGLAGDGVRNEKDEIAYSRKFLDKATKAGKFVLSVEYLSDKAAVSTYLKDVAKTDYVPYVGPRDLDRIMPPLSGTTKASKASVADHDMTVLVDTAAADVIGGSDGDDRIEGRGGADILAGGKGDDRMIGLSGNDQLVGGDGDDRLSGGRGFDRLSGGEGDDRLNGGSGNDRLRGDGGRDDLNGGSGADLLSGGANFDTFTFNTALGAGNVDTIVGYRSTSDTMRLDNAIFTGLAVGTLPASAFHIGTTAGDESDRIIYDNVSGALFFDPDGSATGSAQFQFATLVGAPDITRFDVLVI
jgi:cysteinyl-tRNA synthetase, unknown class